MPKAAEQSMKRTAKARGYGKRRTAKYVYGGLRAMGWKPSRERAKYRRRKSA